MGGAAAAPTKRRLTAPSSGAPSFQNESRNINNLSVIPAKTVI